MRTGSEPRAVPTSSGGRQLKGVKQRFRAARVRPRARVLNSERPLSAVDPCLQCWSDETVPYLAISQSLPLVITIVVLLATTLSGCNGTEAKGAAERQVEAFHSHLNEGQYDAIYAQADDTFRSAGSKADTIAFIAAVHRKLGNAKSAAEQGYFVNLSTGGTIVNLTFQTQFDQGSATERFSFKVNGNDARLAGYRIESQELVTR